MNYIVTIDGQKFRGELMSVCRDGCIQVRSDGAAMLSPLWRSLLFKPDGSPVYSGCRTVTLKPVESLADNKEFMELREGTKKAEPVKAPPAAKDMHEGYYDDGFGFEVEDASRS